VRNLVRIKPGIDVRGDGGYVVAPPSVHSDGSVYEWTIRPEDKSFAELPPALADLIAPVERKDLPAAELPISSEEKLTTLGGVPRAYRNEIEQLFGQLVQAKEGQRNDTLNRVAFALGQLSMSGVVDADWAQNELSAIAEQIGLSGSESEATIKSGFDAGVSKPREDLQVFYQILDSLPEVMDRPLRLIDGKAYGATWLPIAPHGDAVGKASQTELVIFTAHGDFYSAADIPGSRPLDDLPLRIKLPFVPAPDKLLSPAGFRALMNGEKLNPARLFAQVTETVDRFVSFENSLAD
jgi:Bifunctional DNA primase/polymerase, N-terminal